MNLVLMTAFWRERFTSPIRVLLLLTFWGFGLLFGFLKRPVPMPGADLPIWPILVLGAGVIGRDLSSGVLQLILARPVGRAEYVFSRWLGLTLAGFAVSLLGWLLVLPFSLTTGGTTLPEALRLLSEYLLNAAALSAVVTGLSALVAGFGDLALLLLGYLAGGGMTLVGQFKHIDLLVRLGTEIQHTLMPEFAWKSVTEGGPHFYPLVLWASTVTLFLLIGVFAMNRKELSYATAG